MGDIEKEIEKKFKKREGGKKNPEKGSDLERIDKEKSIADIMREYDCSEEAAEKILREKNAVEAIEGY